MKKTVRVNHHFMHSAEQVFDAWLEPEKARRFLFATATGRMIKAEIDPRIGGRFEFIDRREGEDILHTGEYREIDRPRRLAFTFVVPRYSTESSGVTIDIERSGAGCELSLMHEGVLVEYEARTIEGWSKILNGLAAALKSSD